MCHHTFTFTRSFSSHLCLMSSCSHCLSSYFLCVLLFFFFCIMYYSSSHSFVSSLFSLSSVLCVMSSVLSFSCSLSPLILLLLYYLLSLISYGFILCLAVLLRLDSSTNHCIAVNLGLLSCYLCIIACISRYSMFKHRSKVQGRTNNGQSVSWGSIVVR